MLGRFFDANVLVYLASGDAAKADRTEEILAQGGTISVQVLNELANVTRRKLRFSWREANDFLSLIGALLPVHPITIDIHETGIAVAERYGLSVYDAMIAASALHADCDILWSEDMQNGLIIENRVRIADPFRSRDGG